MERKKVAIIGVADQETTSVIRAALAEVNVNALKTLETPATIIPSPTMKVHFPGGEVIAMNRRERRRRHLYGDRLRHVRRLSTPA